MRVVRAGSVAGVLPMVCEASGFDGRTPYFGALVFERVQAPRALVPQFSGKVYMCGVHGFHQYAAARGVAANRRWWHDNGMHSVPCVGVPPGCCITAVMGGVAGSARLGKWGVGLHGVRRMCHAL
jgi:hypothetical protein